MEENDVKPKIRFSADRDKIFASIAKAQGKFVSVPKGKTANAGSYSYSYADYADVLKMVLPILSGEGLCVLQPLTGTDGRVEVSTIIGHSSGQFLEATVEVPKQSKVQDIGSVITYFKRYTLSACLGVAMDEDTDVLGVAGEPPQDQDVRRGQAWQQSKKSSSPDPFAKEKSKMKEESLPSRVLILEEEGELIEGSDSIVLFAGAKAKGWHPHHTINHFEKHWQEYCANLTLPAREKFRNDLDAYKVKHGKEAA